MVRRVSRGRPSARRVEEVERLVRTIGEWSRGRDDIEAMGVVGSWARDDAHADSDVDVVLITNDVSAHVEGRGLLEVFSGATDVRTESRGALTERRLQLPSGLELEVGVTTPAWASTDPVDPGTARVVRDGLRIIHDPKGLLAALALRCP